MKNKFKQLTLFVDVKSVDKDNRRITFCINKENVDRHEEIVTAQALQKAMSGFSRNPIFLACHMHRCNTAYPTCIGSWDTSTFELKNGKSYLEAEFADADLAEQYWLLYSQKHMKAVSIGFRPVKWHQEDVKGKSIYIFTEIELVEISAVAVGANRDALSKNKNFEGIFEEPKDKTISNDNLNEVLNKLHDLSEEVLDLKALMCAGNNSKQDSDEDFFELDGEDIQPDDPEESQQLSAESVFSTLNKVNKN